RIDLLTNRAQQHSHDFRRQFIGQMVQVLVENSSLSPSNLDHFSPVAATPASPLSPMGVATQASQLQEGRGEGLIRHGRCERYFDVHFESESACAGDLVKLRVDRVTPQRTI